jgi:hypothetical protein
MLNAKQNYAMERPDIIRVQGIQASAIQQIHEKKDFDAFFMDS